MDLIYEGWKTLSILVNGAPLGFLTTRLDLGKEILLVHIYFLIVAEVLRRNLNKHKLSNSIYGVKASSNILPSTHQQFMDDTMLFGKAILSESKAWKSLLGNYAKLSR